MTCSSKQECLDHGVLVPEECNKCPKNEVNNSEFLKRSLLITDSKIERYVIATQFAMRVSIGLATEEEVEFFNKFLSMGESIQFESIDDFKRYLMEDLNCLDLK